MSLVQVNPVISPVHKQSKPPVRFSGLTKVNSKFAKDFQVGDWVVTVRGGEATQYRTEMLYQQVVAINPHLSEVDSYGSRVPELVPKADDHVDMVTFADGNGKKTRELVGEYVLRSGAPSRDLHFNFVGRHANGTPMEDVEAGMRLNINKHYKPQEGLNAFARDFNYLSEENLQLSDHNRKILEALRETVADMSAKIKAGTQKGRKHKFLTAYVEQLRKILYDK